MSDYSKMTKAQLLQVIFNLEDCLPTESFTLHFVMRCQNRDKGYQKLHGYLDNVEDPPWEDYYSE